MLDDAIGIHNLSATMDDIKRNPTQPTAEETTAIDEILSSYSPSNPLSSLHHHCPVLCSMGSGGPVYTDQSTGRLLDPVLVHKAMDEEFAYMRKLPVWKEYSTLEELYRNHPVLDSRIIGTRWVLVNKVEDVKPDIRLG